MNILVYLVYPGLLFYLFYGAKISKKKEWNEEFLSLSMTKALQGFCAIAIMMHHIAQKTSASWLPKSVTHQGLEPFVPIGTFFVGFFFFCSGYGLVKSMHEKENYLDNFYTRRMRIILFAFLITNLIFFLVRYKLADHLVIGMPWFFHLQGTALPNKYSWYALVIFYFYLVFYLAFRFCKKESIAIGIVFLVSILYMLNCDWWMFGDWWYNTILIFPLGMLFAKNQTKILAHWKKRYMLVAPIAGILTVACLITSEYMKYNENRFLWLPFIAYRWSVILMQLLAAIFFVMLVLLLNLKIQVGNKALAYMGTLTLEFYLLHGLFVQLFGYNFFDDKASKILYIKSLPIYIVVVFALSLACAILLKILLRFLMRFMEKKQELVHYVLFGKWKRNLIIALLIIGAIIGFLSSDAKKRHRNVQSMYEAYIQDNITYVDVDGHRMAAYDKGEGQHTVVILRSMEDPCPTISYKPIADRLANNNRVIVLDFLGTGFSEDTDTPRTSENICYEVNTAVKKLGVEGKIVLLSHFDAGVYAQAYASLYGDEVEALVCVDTLVPNYLTDQEMPKDVSPRDWKRAVTKQCQIRRLLYKVSKWTGYTTIHWPGMELVLSSGHTSGELRIMEEVFYRHYLTENAVDEIVMQYDNFEYAKNCTFAEDLPVLFLLSYYTCEGYVFGENYDWIAEHEKLITNPKCQQYVVVSGNPYVIYRNQDIIVKRTQMLIDSLDEIE